MSAPPRAWTPDVPLHDYKPCENKEHATVHCGFWNYVRGEECGKPREWHGPVVGGVPLSASPEIRAAVATALQQAAPPLTDEDLLAAEEFSDELWRDVPQREAKDLIRRLVAEVRRLRAESESSFRVGKAAADLLLASDEARARAEAEVRRLRSDEWLEKAAAEIRNETDQDGAISTYDAEDRWMSGEKAILAILRKHRA